MQDNLYFEISNGGDIVRVAPKERTHLGATDYWDKNWITTIISVQGGAFSGKYEADFMASDFETFKQELELLYENLKGGATFSGLERQLELKCIGDGLGHIKIDVVAQNFPGYGAELTYTINIDQTFIKPLVKQLDEITKAFSVMK